MKGFVRTSHINKAACATCCCCCCAKNCDDTPVTVGLCQKFAA